MYPKVQKRMPAQPAATDQALPPPSGNDSCSGSSDSDSRPACCSAGLSEVLLCSLRDEESDIDLEDMIKLRVTSLSGPVLKLNSACILGALWC
jgi:hypothetical protein